ncbi:endolytic transglycosylase MltG [bacterium]|nr:endolytic transglycosylase MltG [bacterium]
MRKFFLTFLALALAGAMGLAGGKVWLESWAQTPVRVSTPVDVTLAPGTGLKHLGNALEAKGVVTSAFLFSLLVRLTGNFQHFQAGPYRFEGDVTPVQVETTFTEGKIFTPVVAQFTIPEGFTMRKIADRMAANGIGTAKGNLALMRKPSFIRTLPGLAALKAKTVEGFLYPATYSFAKMPTPEDTIGTMIAEFFKRLPADYEARASAKKLGLVEAVNFASMIELETLHEDEKPLVSEVIWNRLRDGAPLGIDAALIYGIEDYDGDLRWKDLGDRGNPYNTRVFKGLPPTPIGSVTVSSLEAVLTPAREGYYYYVLMPGSDQRHHFSRSLKEHNEHVRQLVKSSRSEKEVQNGSEKSKRHKR